ncbi:hypothetical protein ACFL7M_07055 [Thermodesulfobacteriota bacterium]
MACTTIAGNAEEGRYFITNREQILQHHGKTSKIDLADAKYDESITMPSPDLKALSSPSRRLYTSRRPIIDYNPRAENLAAIALKDRGHDRNGWPFAPCGLLTRPKEQVLPAGGSVSHQRIRLSFDTPRIAITGSITMVLQSTCLPGSSQD